MNWKLKREGKFWGKKYDDIPVSENEEDLLEALLYVTTNATRHGLLENSRDWPGLNSFKHLLVETDRKFSFNHYSKIDPAQQISRHTLKLSILPMFLSLSKSERLGEMEKLLTEKMNFYAEERRSEGKGFLGLKKILSIPLGDKPYEVSKSKRPVCYTKSLETLLERRKAHKLRVLAYREASFEYRLGKLDAEFPVYSFKPPLHRASRLCAFQPLSPDFLKKAA